MNKSFLISLVLQLAVLLLPFLGSIFHVAPLTGAEWIAVIGLGLMPLVISEIVKAIKRARARAKA